MIPVEADELQEFVPTVLANLPAPPVFLLRSASGREWRKYQYIMRAEGLEFHSKDAFRAETLKALQELWSPADFEAHSARLRAHWALLDQKGEPDEKEEAAINDLMGRLVREWRPLAVMAADNMRFGEESLGIAASMFVVGWRNVDVPYRRDAGRVPLELLDQVETWLTTTEKKAAEDKIDGVLEPGMAFLQLCNAAYGRLHLTGQEEKNSSSPPHSPPSRNGSTRRRSTRTAGARSKASASSAPAPAG